MGKTKSNHGNTYGIFNGKKSVLVHRWIYEKLKGPIPKGFVIDHLCRNGLCFNIEHLEAVSNKENILRGFGACAINKRKTRCIRGHKLLPPNLLKSNRNKRVCRKCNKIIRELNKQGIFIKNLKKRKDT